MNILLEFVLFISVLALFCNCMDKTGKGKAARQNEEQTRPSHVDEDVSPNGMDLASDVRQNQAQTRPSYDDDDFIDGYYENFLGSYGNV
ncbi:hypothetical protein niasHT_025587 [Heterodera trifolii]|uniref:Uncharacterized protein n=1 Tax=Heterodera trifolii TaxID=157864 RepID=A0ABD2K087_9BILA